MIFEYIYHDFHLLSGTFLQYHESHYRFDCNQIRKKLKNQLRCGIMQNFRTVI